MIKTLVLAGGSLLVAFLLSVTYVGYPRSGETYQTQHRKYRKSVRTGSRYYYWRSSYGGGGLRSGK